MRALATVSLLGLLVLVVAGCGRVTIDGGSNDAGPPSYEVPPECANPGPFAVPSATSISSQFVGTWINCGISIFPPTPVPDGGLASSDDVGFVVRANGTWQKLGDTGGKLVSLTTHTDYGDWSTYPGGVNVENVRMSWDTASLAVDPMFSADGRSMYVATPTTPQTTVVKAIGTE